MKTLKLKFDFDAFYNGQLVFEKGKTYDVSTELGWAQRWVVRGATEVVEQVVEVEQDKAVDVPEIVKETKKAVKKKVSI